MKFPSTKFTVVFGCGAGEGGPRGHGRRRAAVREPCGVRRGGVVLRGSTAAAVEAGRARSIGGGARRCECGGCIVGRRRAGFIKWPGARLRQRARRGRGAGVVRRRGPLLFAGGRLGADATRRCVHAHAVPAKSPFASSGQILVRVLPAYTNHVRDADAGQAPRAAAQASRRLSSPHCSTAARAMPPSLGSASARSGESRARRPPSSCRLFLGSRSRDRDRDRDMERAPLLSSSLSLSFRRPRRRAGSLLLLLVSSPVFLLLVLLVLDMMETFVRFDGSALLRRRPSWTQALCRSICVSLVLNLKIAIAAASRSTNDSLELLCRLGSARMRAILASTGPSLRTLQNRTALERPQSPMPIDRCQRVSCWWRTSLCASVAALPDHLRLDKQLLGGAARGTRRPRDKR